MDAIIFAEWKDCFGCFNRGTFAVKADEDVQTGTIDGYLTIRNKLVSSLDDEDITLLKYACVPADGSVYYV